MRATRPDARMDAEGERGAVGGDVIEKLIELVRAPPHHMQHRPEHFFLELTRAVEFDDRGRNISPCVGGLAF